MNKILANQEVRYHDPVVFETKGRYSMDAAVEILTWLERQPDCVIRDTSWKCPEHGRLIEVGIPVRVGNIEFTIMCSFEEIFVKRLSGNKMTFYGICEKIRDLDFKET